MYILDVNDVVFFLNNLHHPHDGCDIKSFIKLAIGHTPLASGNNLLQTRSTDDSSKNFIFISFHTFGMLFPLLITRITY